MRSRLLEASVRLLDLLCIGAAVPLTIRACHAVGGQGCVASGPGDGALLLMALGLWTPAAWFFRVYESFRTRSVWTELGRIARALAAVALLFVAVLFFLRVNGSLSRSLLAWSVAAAFALLGGSRVVIRVGARAVRRRGHDRRMLAIVGSGGLARDVSITVARNPEWGYRVAGFVVEAGNEPPLPRESVLGRIPDLARILDENVIDEVVVALPGDRLPAFEEAFRLCQEQGVPARICLDLFATRHGRAEVGDLDGLPVLSVSRVPSDEVALFLKRTFDVVASALALLILSPVLAGAAFAIRVDSPGPIFFRQVRVGRNGREFKILKFRSMAIDAEARLASLRERNEVSGPVFKMRDDPRVTRVGRFLRRTSLDELPQFLNVLAGDMSIVGPRPPIPAEVRLYERWQRRRLSVKPGITCTWQVSGRSNIPFDQWMRLDLEYIDSWSLWQDIRICLRTVPAVLLSRGAH